jgi:hypothetical protein
LLEAADVSSTESVTGSADGSTWGCTLFWFAAGFDCPLRICVADGALAVVAVAVLAEPRFPME